MKNLYFTDLYSDIVISIYVTDLYTARPIGLCFTFSLSVMSDVNSSVQHFT